MQIVKPFLFRQRVGRHRFTFSHYIIEDQMGVNSQISKDSHVVLWDFDDVAFWVVLVSLVTVKRLYGLPRIHIMRSKDDMHWHAFCLYRVSWRKCVEIVASTVDVDWQFFRFGVLRGAFTLRVTGKNGVYPREVYLIRGRKPEDVRLSELKTFVSYEAIL